jgi:hypothetical protein
MKINTVFTFLLIFAAFQLSHAQESDSTKNAGYINGSIGVTNNGISLIPSFSLEQPALLFNMSLGKGRFSFDPTFTFSLKEARPWFQLFWLRYKVVNKGKFRLSAGTHLGLNFIRTLNLNQTKIIETDRYLVGELVPNYIINEHVSVGLYYIHAIPFDVETTRHTDFLTINANFTRLPIGKELLFSVNPQLYYLNLYGDEGYYATSTFTLEKRGWPVALSSLMNKVIDTKVPNSKDFLWNLTLTYTFKTATLSTKSESR